MLKIILGLLEPFFQSDGTSSPHLVTIRSATIQSYHGTEQVLVMIFAVSPCHVIKIWAPAAIYDCHVQPTHPPISFKTRDQEPPIVLTDHPWKGSQAP